MRDIKTHVANQKGFTLIELAVTSFVVVLALVGYVGATTFLQRHSESKFEESVAIQDANRVFEQMRQQASSGTFPGNVTGQFSDGAAVAAFNGLNLTNEAVTVSYADTTDNPLDVTVSVAWLNNQGVNMTKALRSYVTQRSS